MIRTTRHTPGIATAGIATAGIALVALGGLVACASAPRVEHPGLTVEPPTAWAAGTAPAAASAIDPDWWQELGEPALDELISEGLAHNHDLTLAAARVDLALAQARLAGAPALPQVAAGGDATRSRRNFIGFPAFGGAGAGGVASTTTTTYGASLSASWEVDLWGRLRADAAAAIADLQASQLDLAGARLSLTAQIVRSYTAAAEAGRQVDLAQATAANQRTAAAQIERRYERGVRSALDVRLSRATAAGAEAMVAARQRQHDGVVRQLELLLGRYPSAALAIGTAPPAVGAAVPVGLPAELIGRRPDLAAAERRLTAADLRVAAARRALLPRISLTASGGRSSEALGDLLDGDYSVWNLVGNLTVPLFQGGRLRPGRCGRRRSRRRAGVVRLPRPARLRRGRAGAESGAAAGHAGTRPARSGHRGGRRRTPGRRSLPPRSHQPDHAAGSPASVLRRAEPAAHDTASAGRCPRRPARRPRRRLHPHRWDDDRWLSFSSSWPCQRPS